MCFLRSELSEGKGEGNNDKKKQHMNTNIFKCGCCGWIGFRSQVRLEANDDTYDNMCPRCNNEYVTELTEKEVRREQCKKPFLNCYVTLALAHRAFQSVGDRRAQIGQFDESWTRNHSLTDPSLGLLIQSNSKD